MKLAVRTTLAVLTLVAGSAAHADIFHPGLYTVINYSAAYPDYKSIANVYTPSSLDGVEADLGWRFNRYYSVEASYSYFTGSKDSHGTAFTDTLQTASLDGLGYLPLGRSSAWALYGDVGATAYFASATTAKASEGHENRFGGRAGGGLQYQIDDDLGVRVSGRYEWADLTNMRAAEVVAIGLVWQR